MDPPGKGKAPRSTRAEEDPEPEAVRREVAAARELLLRCGDRAEDVLALRRGPRHPYFGVLTPFQWMRFVEVHHRHHLKIIGEIRV